MTATDRSHEGGSLADEVDAMVLCNHDAEYGGNV